MSHEWGDDLIDDGWSNDDDDVNEVVPCPKCSAEIYEDAERCPVCGEYVVHGANPWSGQPVWWVVLGLAGVLALILALSGLCL